MSEKQYKKQRERVRLIATKLISRPDFQADIKTLRKKWKIPQDGIKSNKGSEQWHRWLDQVSDEFADAEWPAVSRELRQMREQAKTVQDHRAFEARQKEFNQKIPINDFNNDLDTLVMKYKQALRFKDSIRHYLLFNSPEHMRLPLGVSIRTNRSKDDFHIITEVLVSIEADTTIEDIKTAWPMIKHMQKRLVNYKQEKFQPIKNFARDQRAYELKMSGKKYREIAKILTQEYGKVFSYSDIPPLIKRHKKRLGIN